MSRLTFNQRARRIRLIIAVCAIAGLVTVGLSTSATGMPPIYAPGQAHPAVAASNVLTSVSCPTSSFCAAVDEEGNVWFDTSGMWTTQYVDTTNEIYAISCTSSSFCMAVDNGGNALSYDGTSWTSSNIDGTNTINDVSCTSSSYCVAVDASGNYLVYSGSPTPAWSSPAVINQYESFYAVSCVSTTFCMAGSNDAADGYVYTFNGTSWSLLKYINQYGIDSISCVSSSWCAVVQDNGDVWIDSSGTWGGSDLEGANTEAMESVSCSSTSFCSAVDQLGNSFTYNGTSWSSATTADTGNVIDSISCTGSTNCAAVDNAGNYLQYNGTWAAPLLIDSPYEINGMSCTSSSFCGAIDTNGRLSPTTTSPPYSGSSQAHVAMSLGGSSSSVSCQGSTFCMATSGNSGTGNLAARWQSGSGVTTYAASKFATGVGELTGVSCWSSDLCVAVSGNGTSGGASYFNGTKWATMTFSGGTPGDLNAVSCSSGYCYALSSGGAIWTCSVSSACTATSKWTATADGAASPGPGAQSLYCAGTGDCVAVDGDTAYETTDGWGASGTGAYTVTGATDLVSVSCPNSDCTAVDGAAGSGGTAHNVFDSTSPYSGSWTASTPNAGANGYGPTGKSAGEVADSVSCWSTQDCAVGFTGGWAVISSNGDFATGVTTKKIFH